MRRSFSLFSKMRRRALMRCYTTIKNYDNRRKLNGYIKRQTYKAVGRQIKKIDVDSWVPMMVGCVAGFGVTLNIVAAAIFFKNAR